MEFQYKLLKRNNFVQHTLYEVIRIPTEAFLVIADFAGGTGTETDPYQIETADQLFEFAEQVNNGDNFAGKTVQLTADIIIPAGREWVPIV